MRHNLVLRTVEHAEASDSRGKTVHHAIKNTLRVSGIQMARAIQSSLMNADDRLHCELCVQVALPHGGNAYLPIDDLKGMIEDLMDIEQDIKTTPTVTFKVAK